MVRKQWRLAGSCFLLILGVFACTLTTRAESGTQGKVVIAVEDDSGGVVQDVSLELVALATNDTRKAKTLAQGNYTFVDLPIGTYKLTVSKTGYATQIDSAVQVHASQTTSVVVRLKLGQTNETVEVTSESVPLLDTTSNQIGSVVDLKWIEDLPMEGRSLTGLARLTAGYTGDSKSYGVWNGQPFSNQGSNVDGVVGAPTRGKYVGNISPSATPRVENIEEMSIATDQLDLDQGFGLSTMQVSFVTRAGTNQFHGRLFEDFRNSGLYANSYEHNASHARRSKIIYNDFGASLGGPALRDKLFFFAGLSVHHVPGTADSNNYYLPTTVQNGNFTYVDTNNETQSVNLFTLASNYNSSKSTSLTTKMNSVISSEITKINTSLSSGVTSITSDPNVNQIQWQTPTPINIYYPTFRIDYNLSQNVRMNLSMNITDDIEHNSDKANFPGSAFASQAGTYQSKNYTASYGVDVTFTPNLINQLKVGYLYNAHKYNEDSTSDYVTNPTVYWDMDNYGSGNMSGQVYNTPLSNFYPVINITDSMTWQKGAHSMKFGFQGYREQDHYWNAPLGFDNYYLGLADGDPAVNAFSMGASGTLPNASSANLTEAEQIYSVLAGRISYVGGSYAYSKSTGDYKHGVGAYNLDERQTAWGLFWQDSWKLRKGLTVNYGLRWDFTGDNYDLTGAYHSSSEASIYGPSGVGNLFKPGTLTGTNNPTVDAKQHVYAPWRVTPQPAVGFAWNPSNLNGFLGKLTGDGKTVVRGGFSLRRYTMPQQYYWNNASSYGAFFYQSFYLNANNTGTDGTFTPGSLALGDSLPTFGLSPTSYVASEALSDFTFLNTLAVTGIDPHIRQPYNESWNFGIERQIGHGALEIRYSGNRSLHQWLAIDPNEVNIFENGFLSEFKNAQANYTANHNAGLESFAYNGLAGQTKTPIFDAAFSGEASGGTNMGVADYSNSTFLSYIENGNAGAMASVLSGISGTTTYFCNLVGSGFTPCVNNAGYSGTGAGYATNFFQANPYAAGTSTSYMKALGYSNYNALQVDYRLEQWKGLAFDANYTWSKTLGVGSTRSWTGSADNLVTLRNLRRSYGPTPYDIHHVFHWNGTYDLPMGKGQLWLSNNNLLSRVVGNWTVGSIVTVQSGMHQQLYGGNATFNDYADGGLTLTNVTKKQLQKSVGVHRIAGTKNAALIDTKYLKTASGGGANTKYITPNTTPGTIGEQIFLYGPHSFQQDVSLSKSVALPKSVRFRIQGEFLNVWNHPIFGTAMSSIGSSAQASGFALSAATNTERHIEIRANFEF